MARICTVHNVTDGSASLDLQLRLEPRGETREFFGAPLREHCGRLCWELSQERPLLGTLHFQIMFCEQCGGMRERRPSLSTRTGILEIPLSLSVRDGFH